MQTDVTEGGATRFTLEKDEAAIVWTGTGFHTLCVPEIRNYPEKMAAFLGVAALLEDQEFLDEMLGRLGLKEHVRG